ncbi:hypothetical protein C5745_07325 [Sphingobacterium haloxyli]|uniref:Helix-turn-helix domain-containing protein n=2 Tax=Sphingobacterium haloxyli TaxID=2100533 RepID=A0A2S9J5D8_9SPHI|nr:hypothetical protein C5745_07325 [Sphingobacterium haloxyli]
MRRNLRGDDVIEKLQRCRKEDSPIFYIDEAFVEEIMLGCSRPHLVKLLEEGKIQYTKVGKHRRIVFEDVVEYKKQMKAEQKTQLTDMMNLDEDLGLCDS